MELSYRKMSLAAMGEPNGRSKRQEYRHQLGEMVQASVNRGRAPTGRGRWEFRDHLEEELTVPGGHCDFGFGQPVSSLSD